MRKLNPTFTLAEGSHKSIDDGACLMEAVAYVAGEKFSDHPECASKVLGAFGRSLNVTRMVTIDSAAA